MNGPRMLVRVCPIPQLYCFSCIVCLCVHVHCGAWVFAVSVAVFAIVCVQNPIPGKLFNAPAPGKEVPVDYYAGCVMVR